MSDNKFILEKYAALAAVFLSGETLCSQIVLQDFDPDLRMMNWTGDYIGDDSILIDIDSNGIFDLLFYYDIMEGGDVELNVQIHDAVTAIYADENGYVLPLESDGIVWPFLFNWKTNTQIVRSIYISSYDGSYTAFCNSSGNGNTYNNDYIPIKLNFEDGLHYGWIRLSTQNMSGGFCNLANIGSPLVIYDIAYHAIPDEAINCDAKVGPEMVFGFSDNNDHDDFSEFSIEFIYEAIPGLKEMRFYFIPNRPDCINFSVADALALPENRYMKILPDDPGIEEGESHFSPSPDMLDINGDPFQQNHFYSVIMLSVPTDTALMRYHLSVPAKVEEASDNSCTLGNASVDVTTIKRKSNGYAIDLVISADHDETDLSAYKIGFYKSCDGSYLYSHLNEIDLEHLPAVTASGKENYTCHLSEIKTDIFGDIIYADDIYYPVLIGMGDGSNRDGNCYLIGCDEPVWFSSEISPGEDSNYYQISVAENILTIQVLRANTGLLSFNCKTVSGQNILNGNLNQRISKFDLNQFSTGIYFISIYNDEMLLGSDKIIIR